MCNVNIDSEFCVEVIISFIEFEQFKQYIIESETDYVCNQKLYQLTEIIPESFIITNANKYKSIKHLLQNHYNISRNNEPFISELISSYKDKHSNKTELQQLQHLKYLKICHEFYIKYIEIGSEFEINIDYNTRNELTNKLNNFDEWILLNTNTNDISLLFQNSQKIMCNFLYNSFFRFKSSNALKLYLNK